MNRNTNAHFSSLPNVRIGRSILDRSHSYKSSGFVGDIIPVYWDEIYPGDTVNMDTSKVIRFQTMLSPVMDNIFADFYTFFVPLYTIWDHASEFFGENNESAWIPSTEYSIPQLKVTPTGEGSNNKRHTILDYLGYPVEMASQTDYELVSALPVRAYSKICEDWFRDENLTDPINIYTGDATVEASTAVSYIDDVPHGGLPFKASKYKDFWTSMLPSPQKGDPVTFPLISGDLAPVGTTSTSTPIKTGFNVLGMTFHADNTLTNGIHNLVTNVSASESVLDAVSSTSTASLGAALRPDNLWADLSTSVGAVSVNDLRMAFQIQKLLEKDALGGSRYRELVRSHFGVDTGDSRLWRAEYLGGNRFPINVNQVSNTAQSESDPLGDLGAYSLTFDYHSDITKSFSVHGIIMTVMVIRAEHSYCQGIAPKWLRKDRFDYYWPVLANIGEQPYSRKSLYLSSGDTSTFGFQEAWADLRYAPNEVTGTMRPYLSGSLGSWNLADDYSSAPSLSDGWIREPRENVDRTLAVTSETAEQFWFDIYFQIKHTRPMPVYSIPGLIDHH